MPEAVTITVPLRTSRGLNAREHPMARHRRVKAEREAVGWPLKTKPKPTGTVAVRLTRISPSAKGLDGDNLQGALKAIRDEVAAWLGRDDADPTIVWEYSQRRGKTGEWGVQVEVNPTSGKRVYVAGPMTGLPELNFPAFHAAAADLRALGHHVENPAEINSDPAAKWLDCMRADIARLVTCDAIFLLPGWSQSKGANVEYQLAKGLGLEILGGGHA